VTGASPVTEPSFLFVLARERLDVRRFSPRREVAVALGAYAATLLVRAVVVNDRGRARADRNARKLVALERRLGIHTEPELQRLLLTRSQTAATALSVGYVTLNVIVTIGWLGLLFRRRDPSFHRFRRAIVLATLGAQPVFLAFPCAPPRSLDGFHDAVGRVVDLDSGLIVRLYNPLAAMPSIHLAYAVVSSAGLRRAARSRLVRGGAVAYPPAVFFTVVATANHYMLDGIAGLALGLAALRGAGGKGAAPSLHSRRPWRRSSVG
jgi:hypothetical protein